MAILRRVVLTLSVFFLFLASAPGMVSAASATELLIGTATTDITPDRPVALAGQFHPRVTTTVETPVTANIVALESCEGEKTVEQTIFVSCDLIGVARDLLTTIRKQVAAKEPGIDVSKIVVNGTHTHTAPECREGKFSLPDDIMQPKDYIQFAAPRIAAAIVQAWKDRKQGGVTWGLSHAVVGLNRRAVYANGKAQMYGKTDVPEFRQLEGYEDHAIESLFFFDGLGKLTAVAINVVCPSQEVESRRAINADFWHEVRQMLHERYGDEIVVLGWTGAAGDQSPHLMYRKAAEERMRQLRDLTRLQEIARRIVRAVDDTYDVVEKDIHGDVVLRHRVKQLTLPARIVTDEEYKEATRACRDLEADPARYEKNRRRWLWYQATIKRYEAQKEGKPEFTTEVHAIRLGDVAVCTNPFELFVDFGIRIKTRSRAVQTFIIQLSGNPCENLYGGGGYLPTQRAVEGGHYSAVVHSCAVGPEGGQVLVDRTVELINSLWAEADK